MFISLSPPRMSQPDGVAGGWHAETGCEPRASGEKVSEAQVGSRVGACVAAQSAARLSREGAH